MNRLNPNEPHQHLFTSPTHVWQVQESNTDDGRVCFAVLRNATGKRKGPKIIHVMQVASRLNPDSPEGQWVKALMTTCYGSKDQFFDWVCAFHNKYPDKECVVLFSDAALIVEPAGKRKFPGPASISREKTGETRISPAPY